MTNIIIVGASATGHPLATALSKSTTTRILLIDPAKVAYWPVASLRAAVVPGWEKKVHVELTKEKIFPADSKNELIRAKVVKIADGFVELDQEFEGSTKVPFVALAICTGSSQPFPMRPASGASAEEIEAEFAKTQKEIASSTKILVVSGGPTGIEFAGEVLDAHPKMSVTLVHGGANLLDPRVPLKAAKDIKAKLVKAGVKVITGAKVDLKDVAGLQGSVKTFALSNGESVEADYIFLAGGNTPNSQLMKDADPSAVEEHGLIKVDNNMQVISSAFPTAPVFAAGDVASSPGWRSLISGQADANAAAVNIAAAVNGTGAMVPRKPGMFAIMVPIGLNNGGGFLPMSLPFIGQVIPPVFLVRMAKGKTLFVERFAERFLKV